MFYIPREAYDIISCEHMCLQSSPGRSFNDLTTPRRGFNGAVLRETIIKLRVAVSNLKLTMMKLAAALGIALGTHNRECAVNELRKHSADRCAHVVEHGIRTSAYAETWDTSRFPMSLFRITSVPANACRRVRVWFYNPSTYRIPNLPELLNRYEW